MIWDLPPKVPLWVPPKPAIIRAASLGDLEVSRRLISTFPFPMKPPVGGAAVITPTYRTTLSSSSQASTQTFTAVSIGTAVVGRCVIVGMVGGYGTTTINSVTIGGVTATLFDNTQSEAQVGCFAVAQVDTGTTANIVIVQGASQGITISVWTATGITTTPNSHAHSISASPEAVTVTPTAGGFIVMIKGGGSGWTFTSLTGTTLRNNLTPGGGNQGNDRYVDGDTLSGLTGTAVTITLTYGSGGLAKYMAALAW